MATNWLAQHNLPVIADTEGAVVLGKPFIKPWWCATKSVLYEQVGIFVKDYPEGILFVSDFGGQGDVINVRTSLKITRYICIRFERPVRLFALEDNYRCRHFCTKVHSFEKSRKHLTKLFELCPNLFY